MSVSDAKRIEALHKQIERHNKLYFVEARAEVSDQAYDRLLAELAHLEAQHPDLIRPDSPTQRVGGQPIPGFVSVAHAQRMYSIDNTYNRNKLIAWNHRVSKAIADQSTLSDDQPKPIEIDYVVEPKIDGVAVSLRYERGKLLLATTRGDGVRGDDITANARTVHTIPLALQSKEVVPPHVLEIRGELYLPQAEFERINAARHNRGEEPLANPRNATAGTLKQLDPRIVAQRKLLFMAHGRGQVEPDPFLTLSEFLQAIREWGFPTPTVTAKCTGIAGVWDFIESFDRRRGGLGYGTDGVVVKVDRMDWQQQLGHTSKSPRWCIAYKYAAEQANTQLLSIDWQVGKSGKLTPRATMQPVFLAGTTIRHATLHNLGEIRRKDLHLQDRITIQKAGEIIPQVLAVDRTLRPKTAQPIIPPSQCPRCSSTVRVEYDRNREIAIKHWATRSEPHTSRSQDHDMDKALSKAQMPLGEADETGRYCANPECPAQFREKLIHFAGRSQMNIDGLGAEIIDQLLKAALVKRFADLYHLNITDLANLSHESVVQGKVVNVRLGKKSGTSIHRSIQQSKHRGLACVLAALGIAHIGTRTAEIIASKVDSIDNLLSASEETIRASVLESSDAVKLENAKNAAQAFHKALHSKNGNKLIQTAKASVDNGWGEKDQLKKFLNSLPEGGTTWRIKWGKGKGKKDLILQSFHSLDELYTTSPQQLAELFDDEVVGPSLYHYLQSDFGAGVISSLRSAGVNLTSLRRTSPNTSHASFGGKRFVITGTLANLSRQDLTDRLIALDAYVSNSVSKNTNVLIIGDNPGSKLIKAQSLGIEVWDERRLLQKLK